MKFLFICFYFSASLLSAESAQKIFRTSDFITNQCWQAFDKKEWHKLNRLVDENLALYKDKALKEQEVFYLPQPSPLVLRKFYKNLNNVAISLYIKGKSLTIQNKKNASEKIYQKIISDFPFAIITDKTGVILPLKSMLMKDPLPTFKNHLMFSHPKSSFFFNLKYVEDNFSDAWSAFHFGKFSHAIMYATKLFTYFYQKAKEEQKILSLFSKDKLENNKKNNAYLCKLFYNRSCIAEALLIIAETFYSLKDFKHAVPVYQKIINEYPYAVCVAGWQQRYFSWGGYYRPSERAAEILKKLKQKKSE